jgi:hypothetical protein
MGLVHDGARVLGLLAHGVDRTFKDVALALRDNERDDTSSERRASAHESIPDHADSVKLADYFLRTVGRGVQRCVRCLPFLSVGAGEVGRAERLTPGPMLRPGFRKG